MTNEIHANAVVIYQHGDFQGASQQLTEGSYTLASLQIGNDQLSSLRVPSGIKVTLYEHEGFSGRSKTFTEDTRWVGDDFNDLTSSIKIEKISTIPAVVSYQHGEPKSLNLVTNSKIKLKSWKGDYLHRPDSAQGVTTWDTGVGNEWIVESIGDNKIKLKSWKGDYLHRPDSAQDVTTWDTGVGNEWIVESIGDNKIKLKSWKGDYLHRPDSAQGVTTWDTGVGNEWMLEVISVESLTPAPAAEVKPEPTPTAEVKPEPAPTPTPTPQPESTTPDESDSEEVINEFVEAETTGTATGAVAISDIVYKGKVKRTQSDEYIEITNKGTTPADLSGWKVMSGLSKKQSLTFPAGTTLAAGKSFRVYTNEVHPETGGFSIGSTTGIWNDKGDEGKLFDAKGNQVSTLAYGLSGIPGIKAELSVPKLIVQASPSAINKQAALGGKVTFTEALKLAITNFLEDDNDPESPLALIIEQPDAYSLPEGADKAAAITLLRSNLNTAKILLHTPKIGYAPENGETIADNWIFQLDLDDGIIHWAIVDRSGVNAPFNYGFS